MIKQPEHKAGAEFNESRDWMDYQQRQLTDQQQHDFDKLKEKQKKQREAQQQKLDVFKRELEEKARQRKIKNDLVLNPPIKSADPNIRRLAQQALAAERELHKLDQNQQNEQIKTLEKFDRQRGQSKQKTGKEFEESWKTAVQKASKHERQRTRNRDLSKDFGKSR